MGGLLRNAVLDAFHVGHLRPSPHGTASVCDEPAPHNESRRGEGHVCFMPHQLQERDCLVAAYLVCLQVVHDFITAQQLWNGQEFELTTNPVRFLALDNTVRDEVCFIPPSPQDAPMVVMARIEV